ncbi:MAG: hypothetical protein ABI678_18940, partial [Kofleriaceae bacterium]
AEVRYCMAKCDKDSECRDGHECRDFAGMEQYGGQPALAPEEQTSGPTEANSPSFCAVKPAS